MELIPQVTRGSHASQTWQFEQSDSSVTPMQRCRSQPCQPSHIALASFWLKDVVTALDCFTTVARRCSPVPIAHAAGLESMELKPTRGNPRGVAQGRAFATRASEDAVGSVQIARNVNERYPGSQGRGPASGLLGSRARFFWLRCFRRAMWPIPVGRDVPRFKNKGRSTARLRTQARWEDALVRDFDSTSINLRRFP